MARKVTTLFIKDDSINLLVMKGSQVEMWASLLLEPGLVSQGLILDEGQVADKVKELFKLEGVSTRKVVAGLSGLDSLYRIITLPELPEAILPEAVKREASRVMPVSLDEAYFSYQLIPAPAGEKRVFLATFPRNTADALIRTLRRADLEPYLMDLAPLALCRVPDEPRAIIVNARLDHLDIVVIADRLPQLIRRLSILNEEESLSEKMSTITDEFSRTVAFYNSSHLENPLDSTVPVFVCGDLAEAPELWQSLVGRLGSSVSLLPASVESPEGFNSNEFMVNIGLALKELLPENAEANFSIVNFNVLPETYLPKALPVVRILTWVGVAVGVAAIVFMGLLVRNAAADTDELRYELAVAEALVNQRRVEIGVLREEIRSVGAQIGPVEEQIKPVEAAEGVLSGKLASLKGERERANEDLTQIAALLPGDVDLTEVNHMGDSLTVNGLAPYETHVFQYAIALRASGQFPEVIISSIVEDIKEVEGEKFERYQFQFTLR
jgi:type IV pilus assembly protein PilM